MSHKENPMISDWDTISTELDLEAGTQIPQNPTAIKFSEDLRGRPSERNERPGLRSRLSAASIERSLSRTKVEPNVALPPIFKTISYKIDDNASVSNKKQQDLDVSAQALREATWHVKTVDEVAKSLSTDPLNGLTTEQFEKNLKLYGQNVHSPPRTNWFRKIFM